MRRYSAVCLLALAGVALREASRRPGALQHAIASAGVAELAGTPRRCGSDGRRMYSWMNPRSFNTTFGSGLRVERPLPLFLVGCGHSGTTPLVNLLARHPTVYVYSPTAALEYAVRPDGFVRSSFAASSRRDDARIAGLAEAKGAAVNSWLIKSPSNACRLGYIFWTLPAARVVAIVRDGRDVVLSLLDRYPEAAPGGPLVLGRWVHDNVAILLYDGDPRLLIARYEDLFTGTSFRVLRAILRHARVDETALSAMLVAREVMPSASTGAGTPVASAAHTALRTAQLQQPFAQAPARWPDAMGPGLKQTFKANVAAVALLARFGYANDSAW